MVSQIIVIKTVTIQTVVTFDLEILFLKQLNSLSFPKKYRKHIICMNFFRSEKTFTHPRITNYCLKNERGPTYQAKVSLTKPSHILCAFTTYYILHVSIRKKKYIFDC